MFKLIIGNRNYSSWSMRAWLHLRESEVPFEEVRVPLFGEDGWHEEIARYSPAGLVPVLVDGDLAVWDSMAIHEYVLEHWPDAVGWPAAPRARARARSVCAEMHSGFTALREELPQNIRARKRCRLEALSDACRSDIARIEAIWSVARDGHGGAGPWLFGAFSLADVVFAPVALRFVTYGIPVAGEARHFVEQVQALESVREWARLSEEEAEVIDFVDALHGPDTARA